VVEVLGAPLHCDGRASEVVQAPEESLVLEGEHVLPVPPHRVEGVIAGRVVTRPALSFVGMRPIVDGQGDELVEIDVDVRDVEESRRHVLNELPTDSTEGDEPGSLHQHVFHSLLRFLQSQAVGLTHLLDELDLVEDKGWIVLARPDRAGRLRHAAHLPLGHDTTDLQIAPGLLTGVVDDAEDGVLVDVVGQLVLLGRRRARLLAERGGRQHVPATVDSEEDDVQGVADAGAVQEERDRRLHLPTTVPDVKVICDAIPVHVTSCSRWPVAMTAICHGIDSTGRGS